jgi:hypothetical protein
MGLLLITMKKTLVRIDSTAFYRSLHRDRVEVWQG